MVQSEADIDFAAGGHNSRLQRARDERVVLFVRVVPQLLSGPWRK